MTSSLKAGPSFSIIINNYNYDGYLEEAIESCLKQNYPGLEIIAVDDGSTDQSRDILATYNDRINVILKANGGQASAFNAGLKKASGDWIWFLDSDDTLCPGILKEVAVQTIDNPALIYVQPLRVDEAGRTLPDWMQRPEPLQNGMLIPKILEGGVVSLPPTSCLVFNRRILEKFLPLPEKNFSHGIDDYMRRLVLFHGECRSLPLKGTCYRQHSRNYSKNNRQSWPSIKSVWLRKSLVYHAVRMEALNCGLVCAANRCRLDMAHALVYLGICKERKRNSTKALRDLFSAYGKDRSLNRPKKLTYLLLGLGVWLLPSLFAPYPIRLFDYFKSLKILPYMPAAQNR